MSRVRPILLSLAFLTACSGATQLVVVVDTNLDVPGEIDTVEVIITDPDGLQTVVTQSVGGAGDPAFPLTMSVSPDSDRLGPISIAAVGRLAGLEVVRMTATELNLLAGESRVIQLLLLRSCAGRMCEAGRTCGPGGCSRAAVDFEGLAVWNGTPPPFDDSDPCLAMAWDVDDDGQGDVACGGMDCDDSEPLAFSGATESCNGFDDNCDGVIDEDCDCTPLGMMEDCTTSCGSTGQRTCEMTGWAACVPPAEMCNGVDDNCDGVSDESFDYVPTTPVNVSNDMTDPGEYSNEPVLAWTGSGYGFAWDDELAGDGTHFIMLDPAGALASPLLFLGAGRTPSIAFGGGVFAVTFWHRTTDSTTMTDTHHVQVRLVGTDGMPVTDLMRIQSGVDGDPRPRVVWDGSAFVVSYRDGQVYYHRFAPDGTEMGSRVPVPASLPERADLAFDGTVYAFGWDRSGSVYFTRGSDTAGFPMDATAVAPGADAQGTGLAATENGYVMAWRTGTNQVMALGLDATGMPRAVPMTISTTGAARNTGNFPNRNWLEVHQAPGQVLVLYPDARDGDRGLYAARIAPDGSTLQMPARIAEAPPMNGDMPQATWADDRFAVSWEELASLPRTEVMFSTFGCP